MRHYTKVLRSALTKLKCIVDIAEDGLEAVGCCRVTPCFHISSHLITLDLTLAFRNFQGTGARAKAWCLLIHADASLSLHELSGTSGAFSS